MEMDNHMSDKDESCYDNAEAAFSDDEEDLNSKGEARSRGCPGCVSLGPAGRSGFLVAPLTSASGWVSSTGAGCDARVQSPALGTEAGKGAWPWPRVLGRAGTCPGGAAGRHAAPSVPVRRGRLLGSCLCRRPGKVTSFLNLPLQERRESFASILSRRRLWRSQSTSPRTSTSWTSPSGTKSSSCRRAGGHSPCAWPGGSSPELCLVLRGQQGGRLGGHVLGARRGSWSCVRCLLQFRGLGLGAGRPRSPAPQFSLCEF